MTVDDLHKELVRFRGTDQVMIHNGKLMVESRRGAVVQRDSEGEELGTGTASQFATIDVPSWVES